MLLVAWAKTQDGRLSYGSVSNVSSSHVRIELFKNATGIDAVHMPCAASPPSGSLFAAGGTQAPFSATPALLPLIQGGCVKLIAVTSTPTSMPC